MADLPRPINGAEEYLRAVHERLGEMTELLRALLDRTPTPTTQQVGPVVELREPATPTTVAADLKAALDERPAAAEPAPAKKPAARRQRTRTTKE